MPRLRQNEREQAVGMLLAGMAQTQIASHFNVSRMTIYLLNIGRLFSSSCHPKSLLSLLISPVKKRNVLFSGEDVK
jgi:DNA-binding XRE family transcriptional regulator